jgi:tRNA pseudouridine13 synthase
MGYAGLKDRHALTRQWVSAPRLNEAVEAHATEIADPDLRVLRAARHGNKLRVGHLRGNRFEVVLTTSEPAAGFDDDVARVEARLRALAASGVPNRFGEQRFGASGDNAAAGLAILRGTRRERDHRRRQLLLSAAQAAVFNHVLTLREASGGLLRVRTGDVLQKVASGGIVITEDTAVDQARVDAGELCPTGPLPGGREREPPPGTESRALEDEALAAIGATREEFASAGRHLPGARRPVVVSLTLGEPPVQREPEPEPKPEPGPPDTRGVRLRFTLPAGSYATVVVTSLTVDAR